MKNKSKISNQEHKNYKERSSDHDKDRKDGLEFSTDKITRKNQENNHNFTTQIFRKSSISNNSIFSCSNNNNTTSRYDNNGINRSATTNDVHLLIREEHVKLKDGEETNDFTITVNTPFLPKSENATAPQKDSSTEIGENDAEKKPVNFGTTATVLVATTKLKSCLKNPLRKKKKNADSEADGSKKLKKKQSKRHICWEMENDMNLIQNEEDGRGMQSKILNMAIVASGPAFLHGGGLNPESRRSSNPEAPLITDSSICLDLNSQGRKASLLDSLNAVSRTSSTSTLTNTRRRSSVMVTSLVKSLDKLGKYRPSFKPSSNANKPSQLHNIMASATIYTEATKVLTTTTISDATTSASIDTTAMSHSQPTQASSASNPSFACHPNKSNTKLIGDGGAGIIENVNDIITEVSDSPSLSLKSCPASVPRRRKRSVHTHHIDHNNRYEKRRPSVHDEVAKARGKGILSPRFVPRSRHNGISQSRDLHDRILNKRSPKRGRRSRRNSIRNASHNNLKSICT